MTSEGNLASAESVITHRQQQLIPAFVVSITSKSACKEIPENLIDKTLCGRKIYSICWLKSCSGGVSVANYPAMRLHFVAYRLRGDAVLKAPDVHRWLRVIK